MTVQITATASQGFRQTIVAGAGKHQFHADMPLENGGAETAASPHQLLYAAWGACTNMTIQRYCQRKDWPLTSVETCFEEQKGTGGNPPRILKRIRLEGTLDAAQQALLKRVAEACPVNQLILGSKQVVCEWVFSEQP